MPDVNGNTAPDPTEAKMSEIRRCVAMVDAAWKEAAERAAGVPKHYTPRQLEADYADKLRILQNNGPDFVRFLLDRLDRLVGPPAIAVFDGITPNQVPAEKVREALANAPR